MECRPPQPIHRKTQLRFPGVHNLVAPQRKPGVPFISVRELDDWMTGHVDALMHMCMDEWTGMDDWRWMPGWMDARMQKKTR